MDMSLYEFNVGLQWIKGKNSWQDFRRGLIMHTLIFALNEGLTLEMSELFLKRNGIVNL